MQMNELKEGLQKINCVIPMGSKVYYFDYPIHNNVGDMLIWKGTEKFLRESNIRVIKRFSYHLVQYLLGKGELQIPNDAIILCHGGGNFGDLYRVHQNLRKLLVENFPNHKIVILPQSIFYNDNFEMLNDFKLFSRHKNLHIYTRDEKSYLLAAKYLKNVYLSQDMAHALYPILLNSEKESQILYFLRKDKEKMEIGASKLQVDDSSKFDWDMLYSNFDLKLMRLFNKAHNSYKVHKYITTKLLSKLYYLYSNHIIRKAIKLFSKYELIITSRLHGHILACLMEKKNIVLDNSYGKNSSYYNCWTFKVKNSELLKEQ